MKNCPECNSEKIIQNVLVLDRGDGNSNHVLRIAVDEKPDAIFFKHRFYSDVKADVCAGCGHIKFYAENPQILWTAYQNKKNNVS